MESKVKKILTFVLAFAFLFNSVSYASATNNISGLNNKKEIFIDGAKVSISQQYYISAKQDEVYLTEKIIFNDKEYNYKYINASNGDRIVQLEGAEEALIIYNEKSNVMFVNGEKVEMMEEEVKELTFGILNDDWIYQGATKSVINFVAGATAAVIAAGLAAATGGTAGVFLSMASTIVSIGALTCSYIRQSWYRIVGTSVEAKIVTNVYADRSWGEHVGTVTWYGKR